MKRTISTFADEYHKRKALLDAKRDEIHAQWKKFDDAIAAGLTGAPLVRIDQKLRRLQDEGDKLYDDLRDPNAEWKKGF